MLDNVFTLITNSVSISTFFALRKDRGGKRLLLVIVSMVFGMEFGFKFASKQLIYLLNPCHITTALQVSFNDMCYSVGITLYLNY